MRGQIAIFLQMISAANSRGSQGKEPLSVAKADP